MLAPRQSFSISSLAALREVSSIKPKSNMTKTQAEVVLASFMARGWLHKSSRGRYSLSVRSLAELDSYLRTTYPEDFIECSVCNKIMTQGVACDNTDCTCYLHYHCFTNFRRRHSACLQCGKEWPPNAKDKPLIPIGEDAARDGDDGRRRVRIRSAEQSEEETEESSQMQTPTQQPTQRRAARKQDTSMDVDDMVHDHCTRRSGRSQARRR